MGRAPDVVIVLDCSMETMVRRALRRGRLEHRADDCEPAIRQRLETYYTLCEPVLTFYQQKNLLCNVGPPCLPLTSLRANSAGDQDRGSCHGPQPGPLWASFPTAYTGKFGKFHFFHRAVGAQAVWAQLGRLRSEQNDCLQSCNINYILECIHTT